MFVMKHYKNMKRNNNSNHYNCKKMKNKHLYKLVSINHNNLNFQKKIKQITIYQLLHKIVFLHKYINIDNNTFVKKNKIIN